MDSLERTVIWEDANLPVRSNCFLALHGITIAHRNHCIPRIFTATANLFCATRFEVYHLGGATMAPPRGYPQRMNLTASHSPPPLKVFPY